MGAQLCSHNCEVIYNRSMELQQTISTLWISLLNTVFASLAFMVWYLVRVEDTSSKIEEEDIVKNIEEEKEEKVLESNEEKHLYVKSDLRTANNIFEYTEYCGYDAKTSASIKATDNEEYKEIPKIEKPVEKKVVKKEVIFAEPFKWPKQNDVIESMRSLRSNNSQISNELLEKLSANGILRKPTDHEEETNSTNNVKLLELARITGKSLPRKSAYVIWDVFQATSRPGLEHTSSPDVSPSPKIRKPVRMIKKNNDKKNATENKMMSKLNTSPEASPSPRNRKPVKMNSVENNKMNKQTRKSFFNDIKPQNLVRAI